MLIQFTVVEDNQIYVADTEQMVWARVSASAKDLASVVQENGKLIPQGFGIYAMEGRVKPGQAPVGLATFGVFTIPIGTVIKIFLRANVPVVDFTMPVPINKILYEVLPNDPQQVAQAIGAAQEATSGNNQQAETQPSGPQESEGSGGLQAEAPGAERSETETEAERNTSESGVDEGEPVA